MIKHTIFYVCLFMALFTYSSQELEKQESQRVLEKLKVLQGKWSKLKELLPEEVLDTGSLMKFGKLIENDNTTIVSFLVYNNPVPENEEPEIFNFADAIAYCIDNIDDPEDGKYLIEKMITLLYDVGTLTDNTEELLKYDEFFANTLYETIKIFDDKYVDNTVSDEDCEDVTTIITNKILVDILQHRPYVLIVVINHVNSNGLVVLEVVNRWKEEYGYNIENFIDTIEHAVVLSLEPHTNIYRELNTNIYNARGKIKQVRAILEKFEGEDREEALQDME